MRELVVDSVADTVADEVTDGMADTATDIGADSAGGSSHAGAPPHASAATPARVVLTSGFSQRYTGGIKTFDIEAKTLRGIIKAMETRFPGVGEILEEETSVVIDGEMHEVVYTQPVKPGSEVFFLPRIEGG